MQKYELTVSCFIVLFNFTIGQVSFAHLILIMNKFII